MPSPLLIHCAMQKISESRASMFFLTMTWHNSWHLNFVLRCIYRTHFKDHGLAASPFCLFLPLGNPAADLGLVRSYDWGSDTELRLPGHPQSSEPRWSGSRCRCGHAPVQPGQPEIWAWLEYVHYPASYAIEYCTSSNSRFHPRFLASIATNIAAFLPFRMPSTLLSNLEKDRVSSFWELYHA